MPPSSARLAAAARAGLFPRSPLLAAGLVLLAAGSILSLLGERIAAGLRGSIREALSGAAADRSFAGEALLRELGSGLIAVSGVIAAAAAAALAATLVPALVARRRGRGGTAVPLPDRPPGRLSRSVLTAFAISLFALAALLLVKERAFLPADLLAGDPGAIPAAGELLIDLILGAGAVAALAGAADLAVQRVHLWRSLHVTTADASREARRAGADPRVKAEARREARREGAA